jgi:hypothetical protein
LSTGHSFALAPSASQWRFCVEAREAQQRASHFGARSASLALRDQDPRAPDHLPEGRRLAVEALIVESVNQVVFGNVRGIEVMLLREHLAKKGIGEIVLPYPQPRHVFNECAELLDVLRFTYTIIVIFFGHGVVPTRMCLLPATTSALSTLRRA